MSVSLVRALLHLRGLARNVGLQYLSGGRQDVGIITDL